MCEAESDTFVKFIAKFGWNVYRYRKSLVNPWIDDLNNLRNATGSLVNMRPLFFPADDFTESAHEALAMVMF